MGMEKMAAIDEEVVKLKSLGLITKIKYPSWLDNIIMVQNSLNKWKISINFIDLNVVIHKDPYMIPYIDRLIDMLIGYKTLSFMDPYSSYNQIHMDPLDVPKMTFMSNNDNYYYNVMPFGLKNIDTTYQRLTYAVFSKKID